MTRCTNAQHECGAANDSRKAVCMMTRLLLASMFIMWPVSGPAAAAAALKTFNVKQFGATGDGVHDDTEAILSAIKAAGEAGGGTVLLPPSPTPYLITDTIRISTGRIHLIGTGATLYLKEGAGRGPTSFTLCTSLARRKPRSRT